MSVPPFVPPNVPADARASVGRARKGKTSKVNAGAARYVSRTDAGWRFQMRLPSRLALSGASSTIRAALGPRSRPEARRLGQQLAALCTAISEAANVGQLETDMTKPLDEKETALVQQVVNACQNAIKTAVNQRSRAIGLAKGLDAALTSLRLVQTEIGKGEAGARAVIENGDAISRAALRDVLKHASDPDAARKVLDTTLDIPRSLTPENARPMPTAAAQRHATFGAISQAYIDMRKKNDGENHQDIASLELRRQTFIDLKGDRPIDQYYPSDLQDYVADMQWWPGNVTKRSAMQGMNTREILDESKRQNLPPMALKTIQDGYVTNIRTMGRHGMQDLRYRDPFAGAKIVWPQRYRRSQPREELGTKLINRVFRSGVDSGLLDEALLPPFAKLTSRRLGLLVYLRGSDIREKHGVFVGQTDGIVETGAGWTRVPYKTPESLTFFVIHNFFVEIGWVDWMMRRGDGWIFEAAHEHPDPSKYESKVMGRLLKRSGSKAGREVFHNLRGEAIDTMRHANVESRSRRLQAGHELTSIHDKYSFESLSEEACQHLATIPLPKGIDWDIFKGLDFDALAAKRRGRGRPPGGGR